MPRAPFAGLVFLLASLQAASVQPPGTARYFNRGQTFDRFMNDVGAQRALWRANIARTGPPDELVKRLRSVRQGLRFLVVAEDWCPDSVNTVPYVAKLAAAASVELRVIHRTQGGPVMALHRTPDGRTATPTIVLLRDGRDVGAWVERPAVLQRLFLSMAGHPEDVQAMANRQAWYDADGGVTTLTEMVALAEHTMVRR